MRRIKSVDLGIYENGFKQGQIEFRLRPLQLGGALFFGDAGEGGLNNRGAY